jgi:hypothetical protein
MRRLLAVAVLFATGCAGAADDDSSTDEAAIRTDSCPATFELEVDKPKIFARTPTKALDGAAIAATDRTAIAASMARARRFRPQSFSFALKDRANAECTYVSALSTSDAGPRAVLRGTSERPIVDITFGDFRWFAFPKAVAPSGLTFENRARAGIFSATPALVKIGNAKITNAPPAAPTPGPLADVIAELESQDILTGPGRHDDFDVTGDSPLALVKSYIDKKYADDPELRDGYTFEENAADFAMDEQRAGTFAKDVAMANALATIDAWFDGEDEHDAHMTRVRAVLDKLAATGASFGFDGFEQNACAAPTAFLLVVDSAAKRVHGVDLNPCEE